MFEIYVRDESFAFRAFASLSGMLQFLQQIDTQHIAQAISEGSLCRKVYAAAVVKDFHERNLDCFLESRNIQKQICVRNVSENANVSLQTVAENAHNTENYSDE